MFSTRTALCVTTESCTCTSWSFWGGCIFQGSDAVGYINTDFKGYNFSTAPVSALKWKKSLSVLCFFTNLLKFIRSMFKFKETTVDIPVPTGY